MKKKQDTIDLKHGKILSLKVKKQLLKLALTHPNYSSKFASTGNFEKLEFIGDAVIDLIVAQWLLAKMKDEKVGTLSKIRSILVQTDSLYAIAKKLKLDKYMAVEPKYIITKTDLEDCLEAIFGVIYLSRGIKKAYEFFQRAFEEKLAEITKMMKTEEGRKTLEETVVCEKNPINELQEFCQKNKIALPLYTLIRKEGPDHNPTYYVKCNIIYDRTEYSSIESGRNLKEAKRKAAEKVLNDLKK